ncbi:MAG TPA: TldD/PmbA family protein [Syntrophothermus lipocalidus]|uniref:Peptidase U62 modulator of DNA gyrase n=1 Tax=Syntrophothermus lipocalidus (strain DSM 12680 / TGB-C1) TaxID=643648 RepID=D7CKF6_SYNLT|nr:TldD/PmbA family protein [Syntrophothermus lipocalidus]ADI01191.1 peptidase U62 modulator of DNA gyrase [Syntrophothermus lipocalidus DSM 12680]HHV77585.1 TldD/PmbA family protein [Syntrophothermus lipocalidus]
MRDELVKTGEQVVEMARQKGVEAEAFLFYNRELGIEVAQGTVETLAEAEELGIGVRVIKEGRVGFAYSTDLGPEALNQLLDRAVESSKFTASDENNSLPAGRYQYPELNVYDPEVRRVNVEEKIQMARDLESAALAYDRRIKVIEKAAYEDSEFALAVFNTNGIKAFERGAFCTLYAYLVAEEEGDAQTGFGYAAARRVKELDPARVGREAAHNAVRMLGAKTITSRSVPCIFEPYVVTSFLGVLVNSVNADSVQKGKSFLAGKIGQTVAAGNFTLVDDGTSPQGIASFPFDGEGVATQRTVLIDRGILKGFLYDTYTANKANTKSTGNGVRGSFRSLPGVGITNLFVLPGVSRPEQLIKEVSQGLFVTEVMGIHTANPISGDFSVGAAGILIENGELTRPVRSITIAGNLQEFLQGVEGVGEDLRFFGGIGAPTLRVKGLSIAGE